MRIRSLVLLGGCCLAAALLAEADPLAMAAGPSSTPAVAEQFDAVQAQGAPGQVVYEIHAKIMLGSNPCRAQGVSVGFIRHLGGRILELIPTRVAPRASKVACTDEWNPVYRNARTLVKVDKAKIDDVILENLGQLGNRTSIRDVLAGQNVSTSLTGTLERVMGAGGESTGFALETADGDQVELDLRPSGLIGKGQQLDGRQVTVDGNYKTVAGTELSRHVLEVTSLEAAGS